MAPRNPLATLDGIPEPDILENIAARLPSDDVFALRATCRSIQAATFDGFAKRFFSQKCVQFTSDSLKRLVNIYSDTRFKGKLKTLYISNQYFADFLLESHCDEPGHNGFDGPIEAADAYKTYIGDQRDLARKHDDLKLLTQAMKHVKKLDVIAFVSDFADLEYGIDHIGHQKVMRRIGPFSEFSNHPMLRLNSDYRKHHQHVFTTTLHAIHLSKLNVATIKTCYAASEDALTDSSSGGLGKSAKFWSIRLACITTIDLNFQSLVKTQTLSRIMSILTNCKDVTFTFAGGPWSGELAMSVLENLNTNKLQRLWLKNVIFGGTEFVEWLEGCQALQVLKFECVGKVQPGWQSILETVHQDNKNIRHLHIIRPLRFQSTVYFVPAVTPAEQEMCSKDAVEALGAEERLRRYQESFTVHTFPGCDEKIDYDGHACCTGKCGSRGWHVCLSSREDIEKHLPKMANNYEHKPRPALDPSLTAMLGDDLEYPSDSEFDWELF